ncbi:hypothetical protein V6N12_020720 [Hibiscus sabdariffa]|uniref:Uncharacterized protein n=1 Tax=Hibiscus sabdariffa TaxID=183260 RepID=A0ABR2CYZ0_9ROSI
MHQERYRKEWLYPKIADYGSFNKLGRLLISVKAWVFSLKDIASTRDLVHVSPRALDDVRDMGGFEPNYNDS